MSLDNDPLFHNHNNMLSATLPPLTEQPGPSGDVHKALKSDDEEDDFAFLEMETTDETLVESDSSSDEVQSLPQQALPVVTKAVRNSIRHVDSLNNFVKHCKQQHNLFFSSTLPTATEGQEQTRRVHFLAQDPVVHYIPAVQAADRSAVWLTSTDFERQEKEVQMTLWRWENHLSGSVPFDEVNNSVRGLEHLIKDMRPAASVKARPNKKGSGTTRTTAPSTRQAAAPPQPSSKRLHRQAIQAELKRQRQEANHTNGGDATATKVEWDHERIRQVSEQVSRSDLVKVVRLGQQDAQAAMDAWKVVEATAQPESTPTKKKGKGFKFWKRNK